MGESYKKVEFGLSEGKKKKLLPRAVQQWAGSCQEILTSPTESIQDEAQNPMFSDTIRKSQIPRPVPASDSPLRSPILGVSVLGDLSITPLYFRFPFPGP